MMKVLDLFSGVGGMSMALKDVCNTVAYCEIDEMCKRILKKKGQEGLLHEAPILSDVKELSPETCGVPDMISAGFPCQDISCAGSRESKGVDGERSGLFWEILRLYDALPSCHTLFLENVPNIKNKGLEKVVKELEDRGLEVRAGVYSCEQMGGVHLRRRWFCVASKNFAALESLVGGMEKEPSWIPHGDYWDKEPVPRLIPLTKANSDVWHKRRGRGDVRERMRRMGNSVVPWVARNAFISLVTQQDVKCEKSKLLANGVVVNTPDPSITHVSKRWSTPMACYDFMRPFRSTTARAARTLTNSLYWATNTAENMSKAGTPPDELIANYSVNPQWYEWAMGYPVDWTDIPIPAMDFLSHTEKRSRGQKRVRETHTKPQSEQWTQIETDSHAQSSVSDSQHQSHQTEDLCPTEAAS